MKILSLGFTGTQKELNNEQKEALYKLFGLYNSQFDLIELHHGNCIGADTEAVLASKGYPRFYTIAHPPLDTKKEGTAISDYVMEPAPYLERNQNIVDQTEILLVVPRTEHEILRSGTWSTVRYARKKQRQIAFIFPDGRISVEFPYIKEWVVKYPW